jgi:hypothetical protein
MAHYARVENGFVTQIIVAEQAVIDSGKFGNSYQWIQTSYNGNIRKNYAAIGYRYDPLRDAFIPPKPYASWIFNEETCRWIAPVARPNDGKQYVWDEIGQKWFEFAQPIITQ